MKHFLAYGKHTDLGYINYSAHIVAETYEDAYSIAITNADWNNMGHVIIIGVIEHPNPHNYKESK